LTRLDPGTTFRRFMLLRTPLYEFHVSFGAKMVEFAGWEMPLLYRGIVQEHQHTRSSGSLFDVSHMGRLYVSGKDAPAFLDRVLSRNVAKQRIGQSRYSLICNEAGGVLDDVIVSKDAKHWLIVCNASNREKIVKHLASVRDGGGFAVEIADRTQSTAMVAVQGPRVIEILSDTLAIDLKSIPRWGFESGTHMMNRFTVFRSGYSGEDGVEMIVSAQAAASAVKSMAEEMHQPDSVIQPAGLGSRDTLRLEAAMPLYGHELSENIDPISAGLDWAVDLKKDFLGAEALRAVVQRGPAKKLVGLELQGPRIARQGSAVQRDGAAIGQVSSGTFSPTLHKSIAMAYVEAAHAAAAADVQVDLRGAPVAAKIVPLPFYRKPQE